MPVKEVKIVNMRGLHARAAAKFCDMASGFDAQITVAKDGLTVGGCSLMALLMLGAGQGSTITLQAEGEGTEAAITALAALVEHRFGEER